MKKNSGITLIALVVTIAIMLALTEVIIRLSINGGLFNYAGKAAKQTNSVMADEKELSSKMITSNKIEKYTDDRQPLISLVTSEDYGKDISYSVTINDTELNEWQVLLNDGNHIYIILKGFLPASLMPTKSLTYLGTSPNEHRYCVWSKKDSASEIWGWISSSTIWADFAKGYPGATAFGGPTRNQILQSMNVTINNFGYVTNLSQYEKGTLYFSTAHENCGGYWINYYSSSGNSEYLWYLTNGGELRRDESAGWAGYRKWNKS